MMRYLFLILTFAFSTELEVDGNLKVTGTVDANNNPITNVGEPVLISDVATANYVNSRTAGKGRIIELKCPWHVQDGSSEFTGTGSCEPPECPDGWTHLLSSNEVTSACGYYNHSVHVTGNSIRYCIEQENSE